MQAICGPLNARIRLLGTDGWLAWWNSLARGHSDHREEVTCTGMRRRLNGRGPGDAMMTHDG